MRITIIACLTLVTLAGCKQQPTVKMENASVDSVMKQQAAAVKMKPGEWEVTAEMLDTKVTGLPAGTQQPMPQQAKVVTKICLTPEQVEKPTAVFGAGLEQFKNSCIYDTFEMKGGKVDAKVVCNLPQGPKVNSTTHGTFSETAMSTESESNVTGMPNGVSVSSRMKMSGRRVGECSAGTKAG